MKKEKKRTKRSERYGKNLVVAPQWRTSPERVENMRQVALSLGITVTELLETAVDDKLIDFWRGEDLKRAKEILGISPPTELPNVPPPHLRTFTEAKDADAT